MWLWKPVKARTEIDVVGGHEKERGSRIGIQIYIYIYIYIYMYIYIYRERERERERDRAKEITHTY